VRLPLVTFCGSAPAFVVQPPAASKPAFASAGAPVTVTSSSSAMPGAAPRNSKESTTGCPSPAAAAALHVLTPSTAVPHDGARASTSVPSARRSAAPNEEPPSGTRPPFGKTRSVQPMVAAAAALRSSGCCRRESLVAFRNAERAPPSG
jgi:hypothetical protein